MLGSQVGEKGRWGSRSSPLPSDHSGGDAEQNPPSRPDTPRFLSEPRVVGLTHSRQLVGVLPPHSVPTRTE